MRHIINITKGSGIPLIGTMHFGIMDRNTNILEVRPNTTCNINCTFCSVGAGPKAAYAHDFVVEESYLAEEIKKVVEHKAELMDIWINPQGDPTVYPDLIRLIADMRKISSVRDIIIITNGMLLTERKVDELKAAGLTQISLSLNAFSAQKGKELAGLMAYDVEKIKQVAAYAAGKLKLVLTPVCLKGINEQEIESIVSFGKEINAEVMVQNFLRNRRGRNPASQLPWKKFRKNMLALEQKYAIPVLHQGKLTKTRPLPKVAKKGEVIEADIVCDGKYADEKLAVYKGRIITVFDAKRLGRAKMRILRASYNLYFASVIR